MRSLVLKSGLAAGLLHGGIAATSAAPWGGTLPPQDNFVSAAQLQCNAQRCLDPRTGAYTQSTCNRNGCRPLGGIVGYDRSQIGGGRRGGGWGDDRWDNRPRLPQPGYRDSRRWDNDWDDPRPRRRPPPRRYYDDDDY